MTRADQIQELAKAWEACGDDRWIEWEYDSGIHLFMHGRYDWRTGTDTLKMRTEVKIDGTDTDCATPCLALLRDVFGEDWTINQQLDEGSLLWIVAPTAPTPIIDNMAFMWGSSMSRIDAVTLALKERGPTKDDGGLRPGATRPEGEQTIQKEQGGPQSKTGGG